MDIPIQETKGSLTIWVEFCGNNPASGIGLQEVNRSVNMDSFSNHATLKGHLNLKDKQFRIRFMNNNASMLRFTIRIDDLDVRYTPLDVASRRFVLTPGQELTVTGNMDAPNKFQPLKFNASGFILITVYVGRVQFDVRFEY